MTCVGIRSGGSGELRTMSYQSAGVGRLLGTVIFHTNDMNINDPNVSDYTRLGLQNRSRQRW